MPIDIALINPPWPVLDDRAMLQNSLPPLGILSIAAYMEDIGYTVKIYDIHGEKLDDLALRERLLDDSPRVIGISVLTNMTIPAHLIAKICKQELPNSTVIMGGVHAEAMPERVLRNSAIDAVVRGDGEEPVREILDGVPFHLIKGLSYRHEHNIRHNSPRPVNMDLDRYDFPAYHLVDFDNYFPAVGTYRNLPAINMLMTRGCPGRCTFCNSARTTLRSRDPNKVVNQIKMLRENYGIRQIQFYDDTFTVLKKHCTTFCKSLIDAKLDVTWTAYIRGDCFSDDLASLMKKAGCHQVLMGIETGSADIAKRIGKHIDKNRYKETVAIAHRHGLEVRGSFIIGNMGETVQTMEETLQFAIELDVDLFQLNISTPYPGTALYNEAYEKGMLKHRNWYSYGQGSVLVDQPQITDEEIYQFERYAFRRFYLRPRTILRMLKRIRNPRIIRDYVLASVFLLIGVGKKKSNNNWDCWKNRTEDEFLDITQFDEEKLTLSWELRQGKAA